jgi:holliday junction DNA helicase RuvA
VISHLDGTVSAVAPEGAVIEVGGVGLLVQCTPGTLATLRPGERARVATSLVVREDALTLFGFAADDERDVFELLQTASGVGPRLALAMLAVFSPDELRRAVAAEDVTTLTRVPGIGRKGAQRIVLELAGRLGSPGMAAGRGQPGQPGLPPAAGAGLPAAARWRDPVRAGLLNLGWQAREADQAIAAVEADVLAANAVGAANAGGGTANGDAGTANGDAGTANVDARAANGDAGTAHADARAAHADAAADGGAAQEAEVAVMLRAALRKLSRS